MTQGIGGIKVGQEGDNREALAVILRAAKGQSKAGEGVFDLNPDVLYVFWTRPDGSSASAELSSFSVTITR